MRKLLIGPALTAAGWFAGSYYGADARQLVHKSPDDTYQGVEQTLDSLPDSGTTHFEGAAAVPYQLKVDRDPGRSLTLHVLFAGREGGSADFAFAPAGDGKATLVTAHAHGNRAVLEQALAGSPKARLAYAPDWMLNLLTLRPLLQQVAAQIEQGEPASVPGMTEADQEAALPPDKQKQVQEWRQYSATAPATDPNADAQRYLSGGNSS